MSLKYFTDFVAFVFQLLYIFINFTEKERERIKKRKI